MQFLATTDDPIFFFTLHFTGYNLQYNDRSLEHGLLSAIRQTDSLDFPVSFTYTQQQTQDYRGEEETEGSAAFWKVKDLSAAAVVSTVMCALSLATAFNSTELLLFSTLQKTSSRSAIPAQTQEVKYISWSEPSSAPFHSHVRTALAQSILIGIKIEKC